ncbi:MAG: arsenate reductase ArsC [Bacteroidota bacterium]|nr:arsenate reductase ArsC [Bacteroidota bacterium]MDP4233898.1 arsenate reductase ArsC [Bacteroidota bacterium]MDP4243570.1 arsenate reductase ArsC [Bacteroidota bacterium]MDP4289242.1 arsenate reductase ArsC [Bacteroidota bacterium]
MRTRNILFICVHNSARSQMAEAFLNSMCGTEWAAESAGLTPGTLNPLAIDAMMEIGMDISKNPTRDVFDVWKSGKLFELVVTVCDEASAERCPVFPGPARREHWSFPDPSAFTGSYEEQLARTRTVRDAIRARIEEWCHINCKTSEQTLEAVLV